MSRAKRYRLLGGVLAAALGALVLLTLADSAQAQVRPGTAEIKRVIGRVEVLRKGQTQWAPAAVGAKLAEGDEIRSFPGGSAELELPDTSSLLVAENSRVAVTKLAIDPQNQSRLAIFHLAIGKVRAIVAQAAITLVRARQSNFVISTPTGVAAARGSQHPDFAVATDGTRMVVAGFSGTTWVADYATRTPVVVGVNAVVVQVGTAPPTPPIPITALPAPVQAALPTARNPEPPGPAFVAPPAPPPPTPQVTAVVVAAISKSAPAEAVAATGGVLAAAPEAAPQVTAAAVAAAPAQAFAITRAAATAVPAAAPQIAAAAAAAAPAQAAAITSAAATAAPALAPQIAAAATAAAPAQAAAITSAAIAAAPAQAAAITSAAAAVVAAVPPPAPAVAVLIAAPPPTPGPPSNIGTDIAATLVPPALTPLSP